MHERDPWAVIGGVIPAWKNDGRGREIATVTDRDYVTDVRVSSAEDTENRFRGNAGGCVSIAARACGLCSTACRDDEQEAQQTTAGFMAKRVGNDREAIAIERSAIDSASRTIA